MSIIEIVDLHKHYKTGSVCVKALNGITLTINKGDFLAITGKSGCGKTTLLNIIGAIDTPTSGKIYFNEKDINKQRELNVFRRKHVAFIFQFFNLLPMLSVEENIVLPFLLNKRKVDKAELSDILSKLGLSHKRTTLPINLSGGEQQRVAIGRALLAKPDILLADEPTGNLDSSNSNSIMNMLRILNEEHQQTIVLVTHDDAIAEGCPRHIRMSDGKIVEHIINN